jgi:hypothetical protein
MPIAPTLALMCPIEETAAAGSARSCTILLLLSFQATIMTHDMRTTCTTLRT